ncbi:hypothetical protein DF107_09185 [Burkholderia stagnalis]|uniref:hypothetical protein n=1 Tax=Burkholderia stagnalis TaxID=1503054 RepID=UPI000755F5E9|nr:hypothetical protein [Burkholderia stagnalis]AOK53492.1 hypothetical protein WT74_12760 [Burkholderia stagnalis]KVN73013.1 hypothetical protein WT15_25860 [Burkholderia stagnalis]KWO32327.1 hypothetical protein WT96_02600 [Burkholderia stagnalis]KWO34670.1 hypothetical protein WT95_10305 [Burkholderia stagnalis]RQQ07745.1 hypothetical protein DF164_15965 [Burkholderia stagnalis]
MIKLITLATTTAVATLLTGCVVGPDAGYGYGQQTYYSDPGYAYGPSYAPLYGTVNVWGGGGRDHDWDRRDYRRGDRDWRHDRNWGDRNWGGDRNGGDRHWGDRGNGNGNGWGHGNNGNRSNEGNRGNRGDRDWRSGQVDNYRGNGHSH